MQGHVRHNWKTRWFKLSETSLRYYKSQMDTVPQGRIPLTNASLTKQLDDEPREVRIAKCIFVIRLENTL